MLGLVNCDSDQGCNKASANMSAPKLAIFETTTGTEAWGRSAPGAHTGEIRNIN